MSYLLSGFFCVGTFLDVVLGSKWWGGIVDVCLMKIYEQTLDDTEVPPIQDTARVGSKTYSIPSYLSVDPALSIILRIWGEPPHRRNIHYCLQHKMMTSMFVRITWVGMTLRSEIAPPLPPTAVVRQQMI